MSDGDELDLPRQRMCKGISCLVLLELNKDGVPGAVYRSVANCNKHS